MSYHANVAAVLGFVKEVMPKIWQEQPDVKFWVVGKDPTREVRELGTEWVPTDAPIPPSSLPHRVLITGTVPDIRPFLHSATLAVAPIRYGAGIQNKVLEAMACATPVAATSRAVSALTALKGHEVAVADSSDDLAQTVLGLLRDGQGRQKMGLAGRSFVEREHSWPAVAKRLEGLYLDAREQMLGRG
jgi:glycosyltransferase involved in cell wall biosynthesis